MFWCLWCLTSPVRENLIVSLVFLSSGVCVLMLWLLIWKLIDVIKVFSFCGFACLYVSLGLTCRLFIVARHTIGDELLTEPQISSSESFLGSHWYLSPNRQRPVTFCVILNESLWWDLRSYQTQMMWSMNFIKWRFRLENVIILNVWSILHLNNVCSAFE